MQITSLLLTNENAELLLNNNRVITIVGTVITALFGLVSALFVYFFRQIIAQQKTNSDSIATLTISVQENVAQTKSDLRLAEAKLISIEKEQSEHKNKLERHKAAIELHHERIDSLRRSLKMG